MQDKKSVLSAMQETGMVPVFFFSELSLAKEVLDACYDGGARTFEFTNRGPEALDVFVGLVEHVKKYDDVFLGAGTIMTAGHAEEFIEVGAQFIVSPILKMEVGEICRKYSRVWIPGCGTLTEIVTGHDAGADAVKLFPASVVGAAFVRAIKPVVPDILLMPTGGIDRSESCLAEWFDAGVMCVGMGSQLLEEKLIRTQNWRKLSDNVDETIRIVKKIRP